MILIRIKRENSIAYAKISAFSQILILFQKAFPYSASELQLTKIFPFRDDWFLFHRIQNFMYLHRGRLASTPPENLGIGNAKNGGQKNENL